MPAQTVIPAQGRVEKADVRHCEESGGCRTTWQSFSPGSPFDKIATAAFGGFAMTTMLGFSTIPQT